MAVTFKSPDSSYGYSLLPNFDVDPLLISKAKKAGVSVMQNVPGVFVISGKGPSGPAHVFGKVTMKAQVVSLAKSKQIGPSSLNMLKTQFEQALKAGIKHVESEDPSMAYSPSEEADNFVQAPVPAKPKIKVLVPADPDEVPSYSKDVTVPLELATKCGQPVKATSVGSVYHAFLIRKGLNMACRYKGGTLSIRAEGSDLQNLKEELKSLGFDYNKNYASVHLSADSISLAKKALGACIGLVGPQGIQELPDLNLILSLKGA